MSNNHYNCIYKLTAPNGKVYIGQTNDFNRRMLEHGKKTDCKKLFGAIQKYGFCSFTQEILVENVETQEELDNLEMKYIQEYDSIKNGYNIAIGGCSVKREDGHHILYGTGKYEVPTTHPLYSKIQHKEYWKLHKSEINEKNKKYYETHKSECKDRFGKYRESHKEEIKEQKQEYYETHKEETREHQKKYYETHKEELKLKHKKYNETHKSENKERCKRYYDTHKDELKELHKKYQREHNEEIKENKRAYREQNREKLREYHREYQRILRAKKKAVEKNNGQMVLDTFIK